MHSLYLLMCVLQDDVRSRPSILMQGKWRTSDFLTGHWDNARVLEAGV